MIPAKIEPLDSLAALIQSNRSEEAIPLLEQRLTEFPLEDRAWALLGQAFYNQRRYSDAAIALREALRLNPTQAAHYADLGIALKAEGRMGESEALLREGIRRNPTHPLPCYSLANLLVSQRRHPEALAQYQSLLKAHPNFFPALENLTSLQLELGLVKDSVDLLNAALSRAPNDHRILSMLAIALDRGGNQDAALDVTLKAIALDPPRTLDMRLASFMSLTGRTGRLDLRDQVMALLHPAIPATLPDDRKDQWLAAERNALRRIIFLFPYYGIDDRSLMKVHRAVGDQIGLMTRSESLPLPAETGKIRVGFISHNFGNHPIGHLLSIFFEHHGHERHDVFLYATHLYQSDASGYGTRLQKAADHFRDCRNLSDMDFAKLIRNDQLHVLIDLDGYMHGGRPEVLAMRVAPIQIHWLQSLAGCPAPYIDYTIVDRVIVPDDERDQGNGPLIRLADAFQCGERFALPDEPPSRAQCGLPENGFVFCAFGNWLKIDATVFDAWMEILNAVPESVLWLTVGPTPQSLTTIRRAAEARGIDGNRLIVAERTDDKLSHIDRHRCADLYLDTFTFSAATSATDALSAGLPVLTKKGSTAQSRLSESLIRAVGPTALIVPDRETYIKTAIRLAQNPKDLAKHQAALKKALPKAPLFDPKRMVRQFELIYDHVITTAKAEKPPTHYDVVL